MIKLYQLITNLKHTYEIASKETYHEGQFLNFEFKSDSDLSKSEEILRELNPLRYNSNELRIDFNNKDKRLYYDANDFLKSYSHYKGLNEEFAIYIADEKRTSYIHDPNLNDNKPPNFVTNAELYWRIFEDLNGIAEYSDKAKREIILVIQGISSFSIGYPAVTPNLQNVIIQNKDIENFHQKINKDDYLYFLKDAISNILKSYNKMDRLPQMMCKITSILEFSDRNYHLYLSNFSFDKFREGFRKEKEKYFSDIRNIVSSIIGFIAGIPISLSAAIFAIYTTDGKMPHAAIIFGGYFLYVVLTISIINIYQKDSLNVGKQILRDIRIISKETKLSIESMRQDSSIIFQKIKSVYCLSNLIKASLVISIILLLMVPCWNRMSVFIGSLDNQIKNENKAAIKLISNDSVNRIADSAKKTILPLK